MSTEIRKLTLSDVPALREIARQSFTTLWGPSDFAHFLEHPHGFCRGLWEWECNQCALVSYALCLMVAGELDVVSIATCPDRRRRGLAEGLLRSVLQSEAIERAVLEVAIDNPSAIALYKKLGFEIAGVRKNYYQQTKDAYLMTWRKS